MRTPSSWGTDPAEAEGDSPIVGRQVVCLSSLAWHGFPTSRHHLARELARSNQVLFVDPPQNLARIRRLDHVGLHREADTVVRLVPPPHLPYGGGLRFRLATRRNQCRYALSVARAVVELGWTAPTVWNVCPVYHSPLVAEHVQAETYFLHMTDSLWDYPWYRAEYESFMHRITSQAQFALGSTPEITGKLASYGVPAFHLQHGVDVERFEGAAHRTISPPARLMARRAPRLGFVGNIEQRFDVDLARRLAEVGSLTLVGPCSLRGADIRALRRSGVFLEGLVPYEAVPAWLAGFDLALLPYHPTGLVLRSRPLKLLEYLAAGLPVVSIDIAAARELSPHIIVAASPDEFVEATRAVWRERAALVDDTELRRQRVGVARPYSWRRRAMELASLVAMHGGRVT